MYQTIAHVIAALVAALSMTTGMTEALAVVPEPQIVSVSPVEIPSEETVGTDTMVSVIDIDPVLPPVDVEPVLPVVDEDPDDGLVDIEDPEVPLAPDPREWPPLPCCTTVEFHDGMVTLTNTHDGCLCIAVVTEDDFYAGNWVFEDVIGPAISEEDANNRGLVEIEEPDVPLAPAPREMPPLPCCTDVEFRDGMVYLTNTHGGYYSQAVATEDDFYAGNWSWE